MHEWMRECMECVDYHAQCREVGRSSVEVRIKTSRLKRSPAIPHAEKRGEQRHLYLNPQLITIMSEHP